MFQPSRACSARPFQVFSFSCSRNHSATPCFTLRTRTVVALMPSMTIGSSVANTGMPCRDSFFSSLRVLKVSPAGSFDVFADHRGEPGHGAGGFGEQVGHAAVAGDPGGGEPPVGLALGAVFQVQGAGFEAA